jgi:CheY-like chemotaxis protein
LDLEIVLQIVGSARRLGVSAMMGRLPGVPARVLLVEDEALIALMLEDMLEGMDCAITALAPRVPLGVNLAETGDFDLALLDVNVAGENVEPVADALAARGIPYIFATGYGAAGVPSSTAEARWWASLSCPNSWKPPFAGC